MLQLYNTLTGRKEEFIPLKDEVRMYTCGPTVYNYAHIGNLRSYVFADVLRRTLEYSGYRVKQVMNITDLGQLTSDADDGEDKMIKGLKREGKPLTLEAMKELGEFYTTAFINDLKALNVEVPNEMPRASEHIAEDIELIQKLEAKGVAYKTSDGIYFDISKYPAYGTRGGFKLGDLREGARVAVNTEKRNPRDFSLWKFASGGLPGFQSPFGSGYPGWHIECSAMSRKYLGQPFDIHTGGIDLIPTHHQNEIAQSEAAYDAELAKVWMHSEHLNIGEARMAKSSGNFITLQTLKEWGIDPIPYRFYLLGARYRTPIAFPLGKAENGELSAVRSFYSVCEKFIALPLGGKVNPDYKKQFDEAISDDLNTPEAIAILWNVLNDEEMQPANRRATILEFDKVLGLDIENQSKKHAEEMNTVPEDIKKLVAAREAARADADWNRADSLRKEIEAKGFTVRDTEKGTEVEKNL